MKPFYIYISQIIILIMLSCTSGNDRLSPQDSLIGEIVQISLSCKNTEKSLQFYQKLNYAILDVQLDAQVPWALISDGSHLIMLSQNEFPSPALTIYGKSLPDRLRKLQNLVLDIETIPDQNGKLKSAVIQNPTTLGITLIDFDITLLPKPKRQSNFVLGEFSGIKIPVSDIRAAVEFWRKLEFKSQKKKDIPLTLLHDQLQIKVDLVQQDFINNPALSYTNTNEKNLIRTLENAQIGYKKVPFEQKSWMLLESPDQQVIFVELAGRPPIE
jgi:predicted lactoylglutathione lyase